MKKSTTPVAEPYTLRQNIKETAKAIRKNLATVAGSLLIAIVFVIGISAIFALAVGSSLLFGMKDGFDPTSFGLGFVVFILLAALAFSIMAALINIFIALSVNDGARGKKTAIMDVLKRSQSYLVRVIKTEIMLAAIVAAPLVILAAFSLTQLGNSRSLEGAFAYGGLMFLIVIAGTVWAVIALLRYCLAPIVAIFEPKIPVKQTFVRSKHLMEKGGQWFVVKLAFLALLITIILSMFTPEKNYQGYENSDNPIINLISYAMGLFSTGMLVLLYRNRKAVRK